MARFKRGRKSPWARFKGLRKRPMATVHPVFGEIEWDEDIGAWLGSVRIDPFSQFDVVASQRLSEQFGDYNHNESLRDTHASRTFQCLCPAKTEVRPLRHRRLPTSGSARSAKLFASRSRGDLRILSTHT